MNVLSILLAIATLLFQGPNLPAPLLNPQITPPLQQVPPPGATGDSYQLGWTKDPDNGAFCIIIQIAPDAIVNFAQGAFGKELPVDIPPQIQNLAERVIIRVGTGPVEKNPPNPAALSKNTEILPRIANAYDSRPVDTRNPVSIDPPASQNNRDSFASLNSSGLNSGGLGGVGNPTLAQDSRRPISTNVQEQDIVPPTRNSSSPTGSNPFPPLRPSAGNDNFNPTTPPPFSGTPPSTYTTSNPQDPYRSNANNNGFNGQTNPNMSNLNPGLSPQQTAPMGGQATNPPFLPNPFPTNGQQPYPTAQSPYTNAANPYLAQPTTRLASGNPVTLNTPPIYEDQPAAAPASIAWLPFTLLLSIVINVYLGMWMGHLRSRYKQLLGDMRGVPIGD